MHVSACPLYTRKPHFPAPGSSPQRDLLLLHSGAEVPPPPQPLCTSSVAVEVPESLFKKAKLRNNEHAELGMQTTNVTCHTYHVHSSKRGQGGGPEAAFMALPTGLPEQRRPR